ncbi:MAG: alpha/beta hydrolase [Gemmatimonadaceae bacterium]
MPATVPHIRGTMMAPELQPKRHGAVPAGVALAGAAVLVLLSMMVIVPPFSMVLFPIAVGASEYSPFLVLLDLAWCLVVSRLLLGRRRPRVLSQVLLFLSACIAVWPLTTFPRVSSTVSAQLGTEGAPPRFSLMTALKGLPVSSDVVERTIAYAAADGAPLALRLYALPGKAARPTVVVIYGGAWRSGAPTQCENVSRALASKGFTVAAIDYRHSPRFPFPAAIDDVNRALGLLRDSAGAWSIDAERMAVLGRSSGGHLAELAAYRPNAFPLKAVVAVYAPFDLVQGYEDLPSPDPIGVRSVLEDFTGGTPATRGAVYRDASPSSYVRTGVPPTLLVYGGRDHVVKPAFNRGAATKLRLAHVPVVAIELPWAEHGFDMAPAGLGGQLAFSVISDFLDRELRRAQVP